MLALLLALVPLLCLLLGERLPTHKPGHPAAIVHTSLCSVSGLLPVLLRTQLALG